MSSCIIGFGKFSKYYLFILGTVLCRTLKNFIFENQLDPKHDGGIFGFTPELSGHLYVQCFYKYIGLILGGLIMELFLLKKKKRERITEEFQNDENNEEKLLPQQQLIYNESRNYNQKVIEIIVTCFTYCFPNEVIKLLYLFGFERLDIYTFEILYVLYFMKKYFVIHIYNFKIVAIIIAIVPITIILIISALLPYTKHYSSSENNKDKTIYEVVEDMTGNIFYIIPLVFSALISEFILAYGRVKAKVLMDLRYISPYKITIYIGFCGSILALISFVILPFIKCNDRMAVFCKVYENIEMTKNSTDLYIDNPLLYLRHMSQTQNNIYIEIFVIIPIFLILSFGEAICEIFIIYHFNPNYILIRDDIYYVIMRLCFVIINYNNNYNHYLSKTQFIILEIGDIISIFAYSIYLEIIELRFCGLDKYLKRNIIQRAKHTNSSNSNSNEYSNSNENNNNNNIPAENNNRIYDSIGSDENISVEVSDTE